MVNNIQQLYSRFKKNEIVFNFVCFFVCKMVKINVLLMLCLNDNCNYIFLFILCLIYVNVYYESFCFYFYNKYFVNII